tara:strand:- start:360 stop:1253 length:894 start_codon:yes stop_codon:yes gene_type:complete
MTTLILDANNLLYRTFWFSKNNIEGEDLSTLMFLRAVKSYVDKFKPDKIYAAWDKKLSYPSTNFRKNTSNGAYKSNRDSEVAKEAHRNDELIKNLLNCLGIKSMYPNVMEADDVIAYLCHKLPGKKFVVTVDKDLYQLINDSTFVFNPIQKVTVTPDNFMTYTKGVDLDNFLDYKALVGDNSDNIKGLYKVGHKRALNLIEKFKDQSIEEVLNEQQYEIYKKNIQIMDLSLGYRHYPEEEPIYSSQMGEGMPEKDLDTFFDHCVKNKYGSIMKNKDKWINTFKLKDSLQEAIAKLNI